MVEVLFRNCKPSTVKQTKAQQKSYVWVYVRGWVCKHIHICTQMHAQVSRYEPLMHLGSCQTQSGRRDPSGLGKQLTFFSAEDQECLALGCGAQRGRDEVTPLNLEVDGSLIWSLRGLI